MNFRTHINIPVRDLKESLEFYEVIFDIPPTKLKSDYANFKMEDPSLHFAIVQSNQSIISKEEQHFGMEVFSGDELKALQEKFLQKGIKPYKVEENITCCYAVANKFWLRDQDGYKWEFWVKATDSETSEDVKVSKSCCPSL